MPLVELRLVKGQTNAAERQNLITGLTDLFVAAIGRERDFTAITFLELDEKAWLVVGKNLAQLGNDAPKVSLVRIKISRGVYSPEEIFQMIQGTQKLLTRLLRNCSAANHVVIDEIVQTVGER